MRAVIQRVTHASVRIGGAVRGQIGHGLLVLVATCDDDTDEDTTWLAAKIARLRIFDDAGGVMNLSLQDIGGNALVVSQFTLWASYRKGNRPSYLRAGTHAITRPLYEAFVRRLAAELGHDIETGEYGADMQVELLNDGPVTICMDTRNRE